MKTGRYSIKELLTHNEIEQIIIPEIQRDYVWKSKNVEKLLDSIITHYKQKSAQQMAIEINGEKMNHEQITAYLQKEYQRLLFNTKIGFVYAYHDIEYAGKFFLIDGQQRFTTLYLLLLAIYVKNNKQNDFKTLYFKNNNLKIDYKVRENSHNFMLSFVKNELSEKPTEIKLSKAYYNIEYDTDETIVNLIQNYTTIKNLLEENKIAIQKENTFDDFIEYIEDYVEVNYFDTNISEQGEQLYLYMNSRGEFLSHQEIVKSEIIKKEKDSEQKKVIGKDWEEWQNYFWIKRANNENADIGFQEFLKWCTIIHICTEAAESDIEFLASGDRKQTFKEAKENYINRSKKKINEQKELLIAYQKKQFNAGYLKVSFKAVQELFSQPTIADLLGDKILADIGGAINYVTILPSIYYLTKNEWQDDEQKKQEVKRLVMFLFGTTGFLSISKNPDNATIDSLELVKTLCETKKADIIHFLDNTFEARFKSILTPYTRKKLSRYKQAKEHRPKLEQTIWKATLNKKLMNFLKGDYSILFRVTDLYYQKKHSQVISVDETYCQELDAFYKILDETLNKYEVYDNGPKSDKFRRALLTFGNYTVKTNGSYRFGERIEGYSFGYSDNGDNKEMTEIFNKENGSVEKLLIQLREHSQKDLESILAEYKNREPHEKDWRQVFIEHKTLLNYCNKKRILFKNPQQIILISEKDKGFKKVQCKLLESKYKNSKMWVYGHNICVLDFDIKSNKIAYEKGEAYAIDLKYENTKWSYTIIHRNESERAEKLNVFTLNDFGTPNEDFRIIPTNSLIYEDDLTLSILQNIENAKVEIDKKLQKIEALLVKQNHHEIPNKRTSP